MTTQLTKRLRTVSLPLCLMVAWVFASTAAQAEESPLTLRGQLSQGSMVVGQVAPGSTVTLDGDALKVSDDGLFVFGFGRDAAPSATLVVAKPSATGDDAKTRHVLDIAPRTYNEQHINGLPPGKVNPPPERAARLKRERGMVKAARAFNTDDLDWADHFIWPATGRISGVYGSRRVLNGEPKWPHYGVDVAGPVGTPVIAPAGGIIRLAQDDFYYEGGLIILDHGFGVTSAFLHLHSVDVAVGDRIEQGQQIGTIGSTGRATGPHLDWRMNVNGVRIDPQLLVGEMPSAQ